jgi:hypothetical protein
VNLELHGMDFVDAADLARRAAAMHPLARLQPELRAPLATRLDNLSAFVESLRQQSFAFVTLAQAAHAFAHA